MSHKISWTLPEEVGEGRRKKNPHQDHPALPSLRTKCVSSEPGGHLEEPGKIQPSEKTPFLFIHTHPCVIWAPGTSDFLAQRSPGKMKAGVWRRPADQGATCYGQKAMTRGFVRPPVCEAAWRRVKEKCQSSTRAGRPYSLIVDPPIPPHPFFHALRVTREIPKEPKTGLFFLSV